MIIDVCLMSNAKRKLIKNIRSSVEKFSILSFTTFKLPVLVPNAERNAGFNAPPISFPIPTALMKTLPFPGCHRQFSECASLMP